MRKTKFDQINVIPFIDIVLVLLVIVLATATFVVKNELPVDLPKSSSKAKLPPKSILLTIDKDGTIFFGKNQIKFSSLSSHLKKLDPKKDLITLNTDKKSRFETFIKVIHLLKQKGFEKISIVTIK